MDRKKTVGYISTEISGRAWRPAIYLAIARGWPEPSRQLLNAPDLTASMHQYQDKKSEVLLADTRPKMVIQPSRDVVGGHVDVIPHLACKSYVGARK